MQAINQIFTDILSFLQALHINEKYVLLWISAGYIQSIYMKEWRLPDAWKTLILGSIFSVVYAFLLRDAGQKDTWVEFCASYIFATSLYELFLKKLANKILATVTKTYNKLLGKDES